MKSFYIFSFAIAAMLLCFAQYGCTSTKQAEAVVGASPEQVAQAIQENRWIFRTNRVMPQSGRTRNVTGLYEVRSTADTIVVFLPYFGRAYSGAATMNTQSPLDFRTTDFSIDKKEEKNGNWEVVVKPKDNKEIQSMAFSFFTNGSAQLNVLLTNRSPISFSGSVMPRK
ncbi:MAG: DUF4251 domain-containing protein [Agriterribacter sp.]